MSLDDYVILGPLCYRGKEDCRSATCTRMDGGRDENGEWILGACMGYHCSYCDAPCSSQGHRCEASKAMLEAAETVAREEGRIP